MEGDKASILPEKLEKAPLPSCALHVPGIQSPFAFMPGSFPPAAFSHAVPSIWNVLVLLSSDCLLLFL